MAREATDGPRPKRDVPVFSDRARPAAAPSRSSAASTTQSAPVARAGKAVVAEATQPPVRRSLRERVGARVAEAEAEPEPAPRANMSSAAEKKRGVQARRRDVEASGTHAAAAPSKRADKPVARSGRAAPTDSVEEESDALPGSVVALLAVAVLAAAAMVGVLVVTLLGGGLAPPPVAVSPLEAE